MDLKEAAATRPRPPSRNDRPWRDAQAIADLHRLRCTICTKPTIAALNGDALAGGAGLAMACDFVIAAEHGADRLSRGAAGLVAAIVHARPDPPGRRPACPVAAPDRRADRRARPSSWGLVNRVVPADACLDRGDRAGPVAGRPAARCASTTTKRLLDEASGRPHDLRGAAAVSARGPRLRGGAGGHPRLPREASAATWADAATDGDRPSG